MSDCIHPAREIIRLAPGISYGQCSLCGTLVYREGNHWIARPPAGHYMKKAASWQSYKSDREDLK